MLTMLQNWNGSVEVNGVAYDSIQSITSDMLIGGDIHIILHTAQKRANMRTVDTSEQEVRITVKKYMTRPATPEFDFMAKWNKDVPMPLRTMTGVKVKETPGMVYMKLHGDIWAKKISTCMCCGRALTNPVSQYFGIGPECGGHNYVNPFSSDEELEEAVKDYKAKLQNITWEGWIIKSAITKEESV